MDQLKRSKIVSYPKFQAKSGIDCAEMFSPVVMCVTICTVIEITDYIEWPIDQIDVVIAILYVVMKDKAFCIISMGVEMVCDFGCLELVKAIYVLSKFHACRTRPLMTSCAPLDYPYLTHISR